MKAYPSWLINKYFNYNFASTGELDPFSGVCPTIRRGMSRLKVCLMLFTDREISVFTWASVASATRHTDISTCE